MFGVIHPIRSVFIEVSMFDMETKHKAFIMEASTSPSGLANITNSVFAESLANKIINEMSAGGFIE